MALAIRLYKNRHPHIRHQFATSSSISRILQPPSGSSSTRNRNLHSRRDTQDALAPSSLSLTYLSSHIPAGAFATTPLPCSLNGVLGHAVRGGRRAGAPHIIYSFFMDFWDLDRRGPVRFRPPFAQPAPGGRFGEGSPSAARYSVSSRSCVHTRSAAFRKPCSTWRRARKNPDFVIESSGDSRPFSAFDSFRWSKFFCVEKILSPRGLPCAAHNAGTFKAYRGFYQHPYW